MTPDDPIFAKRWDANLLRDADGAPLLPALFVARLGPDVELVDLRARGEAQGALGHVPGSVFRGAAQIPTDRPVVLVDADGKGAASEARRLEAAGHPRVAALAGGLATWRQLGFATVRTPGPQESAPPPARERKPTLSPEDVAEHIGAPDGVRWVRIASLVGHGHCSCVDGREDLSIVGTPGGDAGELLLSLAALERVTGQVLDEGSVRQALVSSLDAFGDFYFHSDRHAMERLLEDARKDPRLDRAVDGLSGPDDLLPLLQSPPPEAREALLEHLVDPAHVGCGHIRLMLQDPDEYGIRGPLVESVLRSIARLWWEGVPDLTFTMLEGEHEEAAVLVVRLEEEVWEGSRVPLVSPAGAGRQVFVNHADVMSFLRRTYAGHHLRGHGPVRVETSRAEDLTKAIDELGTRQLLATVGHLASALPIYEVLFRRDGRFEVREA